MRELTPITTVHGQPSAVSVILRTCTRSRLMQFAFEREQVEAYKVDLQVELKSKNHLKIIVQILQQSLGRG